MATLIRSNFPDLHNLNIEAGAYAVMEYGMQPTVYDKFFQVIPLAGRKEWITSNMAGIGDLDLTGEGEDYPEGSIVEGYDKTFTPLKYTKSLDISEEQWDDDPKGVLSRAETFGRMFGRAAAKKADKLCAAILNGAFDATLTPDGQYLVDTDHPKSPQESGTTYSNKITTVLDANGVAVEEMYEKFYNNAFDMAGDQITVASWSLVVPPALAVPAHKTAKAIYGTTSATNVAGTTAPTPISSGELMGSLGVIVNPYLSAANGGSDTAWFLVANPSSVMLGEGSLLYVERQPLTIFPVERGQKNNDYIMKASIRGTAGARDWRLVWGSTGGG